MNKKRTIPASQTPCSTEGCENMCLCKGLCTICYSRKRASSPERKEAHRINAKKYRNPASSHRARLGKYGLSNQEYLDMVTSQKGVCAICELPPLGKRGAAVLHIDHCHETGRVRGLLCSDCNKGIGQFRESIEAIDAAILYLERYAVI